MFSLVHKLKQLFPFICGSAEKWLEKHRQRRGTMFVAGEILHKHSSHHKHTYHPKFGLNLNCARSSVCRGAFAGIHKFFN